MTISSGPATPPLAPRPAARPPRALRFSTLGLCTAPRHCLFLPLPAPFAANSRATPTEGAGFVVISWLGSTGTLAVVVVVITAPGLASRGRLKTGAAALVLPLGVTLGAPSLPDPRIVESRCFCIRLAARPAMARG